MTFKKSSAVFICILIWTSGSSLVAESPSQETTINGEKLGPSAMGAGIVEGMDAVLARDREAAEQAGETPRDQHDKHGEWVVPSPRATYFPASGNRYVTNKWGDTRMAIGFRGVVGVKGAFFAGQGGGPRVWTSAVRVIGFRNEKRIAATDWFTGIGKEPKWFEMNLFGVDRIVIESRPVHEGAGWYGMDDLTFRRTESSAKESRPTVIDFEDCRPRQKLSGSNYAGLEWETGTGDFRQADILPPPAEPPENEEESDDGGAPPAPPPEPHGAAVGPGLGANWDAVKRGDAGQNSAPPDTCGAVGPNHVVEAVNRVFAVYDKISGALVQQFSLGSFLPGSNGDPRVLYDQHSDRWVIIASNFNSRIYIAVSTSNDPTGTWFKNHFTASADSDSGCFPDYPTLGVDAEGIYTASYMVGCGFSIFALEKAPLIDPSPGLGTITAFRNVAGGTTQPVHTYGTPAGEFCISRNGSASLRVHRVNPPLTAPTLTNLGTVSIPFHTSPPDVPALGSTTPLDSVDARLMNAVYRDGSIWTTHNIGFNGRTACRWYQVGTTPLELLQSGTVSSDTLYYWMPSIAVNDNGDVGMGFSGANANQYAGAYFTGRRYIDPPGEMAEPIQMRQGDAPQNVIDGYGRNRWGDYSLTSLDPMSERELWTVQEYAHANNVWGTHVARLDYGDTVPPTPYPEIISIIPSTTSVALVSSTATEDENPPVEYYFATNGVDGSQDRDWDTDPTYVNIGLLPDNGYPYWVKARDNADPPNETPLSAIALAWTLAIVPEQPTLSNATQSTLDLDVNPGGNPAITRFAIQCTGTDPNDPTWQSQFANAAGQPSATETWQRDDSWGTITLLSLQSDSEYTFAVKAQNQVGVETALGPASTAQTLPPDEIPGDCDGNGAFDLDPDLTCFVNAMLGIDTIPPGGIARSDLNGDGDTDGKDINNFIDCVVGGCP